MNARHAPSGHDASDKDFAGHAVRPSSVRPFSESPSTECLSAECLSAVCLSAVCFGLCADLALCRVFPPRFQTLPKLVLAGAGLWAI
jgi:hypothetical protein